MQWVRVMNREEEGTVRMGWSVFAGGEAVETLWFCWRCRPKPDLIPQSVIRANIITSVFSSSSDGSKWVYSLRYLMQTLNLICAKSDSGSDLPNIQTNDFFQFSEGPTTAFSSGWSEL